MKVMFIAQNASRVASVFTLVKVSAPVLVINTVSILKNIQLSAGKIDKRWEKNYLI